jgi:hypothetical protein
LVCVLDVFLVGVGVNELVDLKDVHEVAVRGV